MYSPSQTQKQQRIECLLSDGLSVETIAMMTGTSVRYVNHFVNPKNNTPMTESIFRAINQKMFDILLDDTDRTFNINSHTFSCFALSEEEAIGKMYKQRPEFRRREILKITASK